MLYRINALVPCNQLVTDFVEILSANRSIRKVRDTS